MSSPRQLRPRGNNNHICLRLRDSWCLPDREHLDESGQLGTELDSQLLPCRPDFPLTEPSICRHTIGFRLSCVRLPGLFLSALWATMGLVIWVMSKYPSLLFLILIFNAYLPLQPFINPFIFVHFFLQCRKKGGMYIRIYKPLAHQV